MAVHLFMPYYFYKVFRKKRQLFYLRNLKLMFHRSTRSLLRNGFLLGGHTLMKNALKRVVIQGG